MDEKRLVDGATALAEKQPRVIKIEPTERPQNVRLRVAAYTRVSSDSEDQLNIEFECDKAVKDGIKIVVLYKACSVDRSKCPEAVRYKGTHAPMWKRENGQIYWDYQSVKNALDN